MTKNQFKQLMLSFGATCKYSGKLKTMFVNGRLLPISILSAYYTIDFKVEFK